MSLCPDVDVAQAVNDLNLSVEAADPFTAGLCTVEYHLKASGLSAGSSGLNKLYNMSLHLHRQSRIYSIRAFLQISFFSSYHLPSKYQNPL